MGKAPILSGSRRPILRWTCRDDKSRRRRSNVRVVRLMNCSGPDPEEGDEQEYPDGEHGAHRPAIWPPRNRAITGVDGDQREEQGQYPRDDDFLCHAIVSSSPTPQLGLQSRARQFSLWSAAPCALQGIYRPSCEHGEALSWGRVIVTIAMTSAAALGRSLCRAANPCGVTARLYGNSQEKRQPTGSTSPASTDTHGSSRPPDHRDSRFRRSARRR